jgi:phosphatidylserine/phosphatidylglycerophosphate/cardiolipin synthase-like enzyme
VKINVPITILTLALTIANTPILADAFIKGAAYKVCFTPGQNCAGELVEAIQHARKEIRIQAYSFTSVPMAKAVVEAKRRGVDVQVILDKSQQRSRYSSATFLKNSGIPVWIDYKPSIAHNKIFIIDKQFVATGSFNFTKAAQTKNAENLLIIKDNQLAKMYLANWEKRLKQSRAYQKFGR